MSSNKRKSYEIKYKQVNNCKDINNLKIEIKNASNINENLTTEVFNYVRNDLFILIEYAIKECSFKELDISSIQLTDEGLINISKALIDNNTINTLYLNSNYNLSVVGFKCFSKALEFNTTLKSWYLNNIFESCSQENCLLYLSKGLKDSKSIENLSLQGTKFDLFSNNAMSNLVNGLLANKSLKKLNLSKCCITDDNLLKVAELFKYDINLLVLDISENLYMDIGIIELVNSLKISNHLKHLDISYNNLSISAFNHFTKYLAQNTSLEVFKFDYNYKNTNNYSVFELSKSLILNKNLKEICIKFNEIKDKINSTSLLYLFYAINLNTCLEIVKFNFYGFKKVDFEKLYKGFILNLKLKSFSITFCSNLINFNNIKNIQKSHFYSNKSEFKLLFESYNFSLFPTPL
jgi:hypothetical protein